MHQDYIVSNFYKFLHLNNVNKFKIGLKKQLHKFDIKGSFLISDEE